jgi:hypothetical protein
VLAAAPLARADEPDFYEVGFRVAIAALLALVAALVLAWPWLIAVAVLLVGGLYGAQLAIDDEPLDLGSAVFAAGALVTAELAYWSLEEREHVKPEEGDELRRLAFVVALGIGALAVSAVLLTLVDGVEAGGLALDVLGAAAAAAVLVAVVLASRGRGRTT